MFQWKIDNMSEFSKLEYIWLDGYEPTQNMRSKTMIRKNFSGNLDACPVWSFDGSSTKQAQATQKLKKEIISLKK